MQSEQQSCIKKQNSNQHYKQFSKFCFKQAHSHWNRWDYLWDISFYTNIDRFQSTFKLISNNWKKSNNERFFLYLNIQMIMKLKISQYNMHKSKHKIIKILLENTIRQNITVLALQESWQNKSMNVIYCSDWSKYWSVYSQCFCSQVCFLMNKKLSLSS